MRKYKLAAVLLFSLLLCGFSARAVSGGDLPADWTKVKELQEGALLKTESGWGVVEDVEYFAEPGIFYNLSVSGPNSDFFANGVLAHNKGEPATPTVYSVSCSGPQANISWNVPSGATYYKLRVDKASDPYGPGSSCSDLFICINNLPNNYYSFNTAAGESYRWWVHACNANGCSSYQVQPYFSCPALWTVSGFVWDDTNEQNCVFNGGTESKMGGQTVHLVGASYSGSVATGGDGSYSFSNVPQGNYSIWVGDEGFPEPKDEWGMYCPATGSYTFTLNANTVVNLGIRNEPPSWIQATNGGVYSAAGVISRVPSTVHPDYEPPFFISADPDDIAGGVCTAKGGITTNGRTSERGDDPGWSVENYEGGISWPAIIDQISQSSGILAYYGTPIIIGDKVYPFRPEIAPLNLFQGKIVLVNGDVYIDSSLGGSAETLNAVLIAKGKITIDDNGGDDLFKVSGALYARDGIFNNRELDNKRIPAISATFDPNLFLNAPESLKEPRIIWREVAP